MANTYSYTPDSRWEVEDPTAINLLNVARMHADHLHEALNIVMDTAAADGIYMSVANPCKVEVAAGVIWSCGWWQSADGRWWQLWREADVASFTRADADFYLPRGDIDDVPLT